MTPFRMPIPRVQPPHASTPLDRWLAAGAAALTALSLLWRQPGLVVDPSAAYLRYAASMLQGSGFRFNAADAPLWGVGAPLWVLLLAGAGGAGMPLEQAARVLPLVLGSLAVALLALAAARAGGVLGGVGCALLAIANAKLGFWAVSGFETPLTYLLIAAGLQTLAVRGRDGLLGLIAGACLVHKFDLAPFGILLIGARWIDEGRFPRRASAAAAACAAAACALAWWTFGTILPNSLVTKLAMPGAGVPWHWFVDAAFFDGGRGVLLVCAGAGAWKLWRDRSVLLVPTVGYLAIVTLAYTVNPPRDSWEWYVAPLQAVLVLLAGIGLAAAVPSTGALRGPAARRSSVAVVLVVAVVALVAWLDRGWAGQGQVTTARERVRAEAGDWVAAHTPATWRVFSHSGHVLYRAGRYALDAGLYSTPRARGGESGLFEATHPEVVVETPDEEQRPPDAYRPFSGYRIAALLRMPSAAPAPRIYAAVQVRADLDLPGESVARAEPGPILLPGKERLRLVSPAPSSRAAGSLGFALAGAAGGGFFLHAAPPYFHDQTAVELVLPQPVAGATEIVADVIFEAPETTSAWPVVLSARPVGEGVAAPPERRLRAKESATLRWQFGPRAVAAVRIELRMAPEASHNDYALVVFRRLSVR